ncbi:RNA polymerase sigma-I factor [Alkalihalobacterium elongatum]|uniref:RNA polymerase sigma-I factor n=1 Tax=Alkalihalobacterium elongatum TaxID=2675466 RepID=UPI001C1FD24B|nr:RNA polymerase sigma-I factor [Alkalihalobacterium elongatum]
MESSKLKNFLAQANTGNDIAREQLIRHYKPYILNVTGHVCKRFITWSDEESSIALIAFNRAIDTFSEEGGRTFQNYVYLLIKRDLIDYFRKEQKEAHLSLTLSDSEHDIPELNFENDQAIEKYEEMVQTHDLVDEILELDQKLREYKISFEELEQYSPKHEDTRLSLFEMAATFTSDDEFVESLIRKKQLPIGPFAKKTGYKRKTIERHRKYVITLILIKLNPQWLHLTEYIKGTQE